MAGKRMLSHLISSTASCLINKQLKLNGIYTPQAPSVVTTVKHMYLAQVAGQLLYDRVRCTVGYVCFIKKVFVCLFVCFFCGNILDLHRRSAMQQGLSIFVM